MQHKTGHDDITWNGNPQEVDTGEAGVQGLPETLGVGSRGRLSEKVDGLRCLPVIPLPQTLEFGGSLDYRDPITFPLL